MMKKPIEESYWVVPGQLLAGEYPRNWDEGSSQKKIDALVRAGVRAFIDLTEEDEELEPYSHLLHVHASKGITHERFPIRDQSVPRSAEATKRILDAIDVQLAQRRAVYVHCLGGIGRTGTIIGCWLSRHGHGGEAAVARLKELWGGCSKAAYCASPETPEQTQYIIHWKE